MSTTGRRKGRTWEEQFVRPLGDSDSALVMLPLRRLRAVVRKRHAGGADRHDEVWDGVYFMAPLADNEHFDVVGHLTAVLISLIPRTRGLRILPGCNVSDDADDWTQNFRGPDVVVYLPGNPAQDRETHYLGGPDFAIEVLSKSDRARQKFGFYAKVGVRELMLVNRRPWAIELYRLSGEDGELVGNVSLNTPPETVASTVLGMTFELVPGEDRPNIKITRLSDGQHQLA